MIISVPEPGDMVETPIGSLCLKDTAFKRWSRGKFFIRYLYEDLLHALAEDMHRNIASNYDNVIVIYGGEGSGKSNLAYALCSAFCSDFDLHEGYIYNNEGFVNLLQTKDLTKQTLWMDEGSNIANNRNWNTEDNKQFVLFLETMRSKRASFIVCIPSKERLDIYLRENRTRYLIKCEPMSFDRVGPKARGYFELKKRSPTGQMQLVGYGEYDPMPEDVASEYEKLKGRSQESIIKKIVSGSDKGQGYKAKYEAKCKEMDSVLLALHDSGYSTDGLMQLYGIKSKKTFYNRIDRARNKGLSNGDNEED